MWNLMLSDALIYYDGPLVMVGQFEGRDDDSHYLRIEAQSTIRPDEGNIYPREIQNISHFLKFPTREALDATLHDEILPTLESYRLAESIHRQIENSTLVSPGVSKGCTLEISEISIDDIPSDELPYTWLRPGAAMEFVGDSFEALCAASKPQYAYPLPMDHGLVFWDVPRAWIGKTERFGKTTYHLQWMVDEKGGWELNYRLSFETEEGLRATLHQGYVATRATYDQAILITREEMTVTEGPPEHWTLKVESLARSDVPEDHLPGEHLEPSPKPA